MSAHLPTLTLIAMFTSSHLISRVSPYMYLFKCISYVSIADIQSILLILVSVVQCSDATLHCDHLTNSSYHLSSCKCNTILLTISPAPFSYRLLPLPSDNYLFGICFCFFVCLFFKGANHVRTFFKRSYLFPS